MKSILIVLCLTWSTLLICASVTLSPSAIRACEQSAKSRLTQGDRIQEGSISAGKLNLVVDKETSQFTVSLPANPTTGYQWVVDAFDTTHFKLLRHRYITDHTQRIGSGGCMLFVFKQKEGVDYPRQTQITFRYLRAWEPDSASLMRVQVTFKKNTQKTH